uniref:Uncharacterized protein n=1 Tax=Sipha flava TaxID=143950 RepID=A0A2S2QCG2_9HEMI
MNVLREHFPERLISLRGDLQWPARSPDLAPCDFFPWGYLKSLVYTDRPRTLRHLKNNIRAAIAVISTDMLEKWTTISNSDYLSALTRTVATYKMSFLKPNRIKL